MYVHKIGVVAVSGLLVLAACSTPPPDANPQIPSIESTPSPSAATSASAEPSASAEVSAQPPTPSAAPPTASSAPAPAADGLCKAASLKISLGAAEGAAGTVHRDLVFTNAGSVPCTIQGFPGVSYVTGADNHQVGPAAVRVGSKGGAIRLAPGASAAAPVSLVQAGNFDPAVCKPTDVRGLRVYPPQETAAVVVPMSGTGCMGAPPGHQLSVKTVQRT